MIKQTNTLTYDEKVLMIRQRFKSAKDLYDYLVGRCKYYFLFRLLPSYSKIPHATV